MLLKKGSTGDDVKRLQEKLGVEPIGTFGPKTEDAVKAWQKKNGLTADGIVGESTWKKLFGVNDQITDAVTQIGELSLDKLRGHVPDSVLAQIPDTAKKFNITTNLRLAHFLAQCSHESGNFKAVSENLNYSADGLKKIFPKYFPGNLNESYARNPEKIASRVYGGRMGNGDESTGEGYKFRGRGYIQLTGKSNYAAFTKFIGEDCVLNPELVATKYPLASAAFFFNKNDLWSICDKGATESVVGLVTKRVNGGTIGLADRIKHFKEYYALLT
ncbi:COG3179 Predicted chitinase [uncultured Caudovirales phage]|uniref:COG3179 Predicted chitinase n=1 Tax=uncultured Caudovirales phage TaxID=2100421 RepID=A0A6J5NL11_9CAUD|nr:COG3179 Predicted chitinase [uncultured Caudovirales phage]